MRSIFIGSGHYLPERIVTNDDLAKIVDTSDEWITARTGIKERRFCAEGENTSDLATKAGQRALDAACINAEDIDAVVVATSTPDHTLPATATKVQTNLGCNHALAFDLNGVCAGYLYALAMADNLLRLGQAKTALVIGADTFSRILDMQDRTTCVLFGDGAGAVVLQATDSENHQGVLSVKLHSDGSHYNLLYADGGPSSSKTSGYVRMQGQEIYRHAVTKLTESAHSTLANHNITAEDIDWMIPHQANARIIDAVAKRLKLPEDKIIKTVARHANTSAASIPLALCESVLDGRVKRGDLILHEAIGAGLVWGSALIRW